MPQRVREPLRREQLAVRIQEVQILGVGVMGDVHVRCEIELAPRHVQLLVVDAGQGAPRRVERSVVAELLEHHQHTMLRSGGMRSVRSREALERLDAQRRPHEMDDAHLRLRDGHLCRP
jgi:hypothetical protein